MKMFVRALLVIQLFNAHAQLIFRQLVENQALELSYSPQRDDCSLMGLRLYHRVPQNQTTLLSMEWGGKLRVNPEHRGRLQVCGGLSSPWVNVTLSNVQLGDAGFYMWELSCEICNSAEHILAQKVFLLVERTGGSCQCSCSYPPLLLTISTAAGLLLLPLSWLVVKTCVKEKHHHPSQPAVAIYEEMSRKQQSAVIPQNSHETPSHLEEANFAVYTNPSFRQPQDNYYACPRQLVHSSPTARPDATSSNVVIAGSDDRKKKAPIPK